MKLAAKIGPYLVIIGLVLIILYLRGCFGSSSEEGEVRIGGKDYQVVKREIDTFYQIESQTIYKKGKDIVHEVEVVKEVPANVDTLSILKDYYSKVFYRDTLKLKDTLGYFVVSDTISKNKIQGRSFQSFIRIPKIKETVYLKELSRDFYVGPSVHLGVPFSLGADAHLKTKKDFLLGFGVGINSNISPYIKGSVSWKINK